MFAGNIGVVERQEQFKKLMYAAEIKREQLPVLNNLKTPIFKELFQRVKTFSGANLITFNNGWLAGFWQGDGGLYISAGPKDRFNVILRAYITQNEAIDTLKRISNP